MSDSRPYSIWNVVLAISDDVPAHEMVFSASRSRAIVGSVTLMPFWSTNVISSVTDSVKNTTSSFFFGSRLVWSYKLFSAADCLRLIAVPIAMVVGGGSYPLLLVRFCAARCTPRVCSAGTSARTLAVVRFRVSRQGEKRINAVGTPAGALERRTIVSQGDEVQIHGQDGPSRGKTKEEGGGKEEESKKKKNQIRKKTTSIRAELRPQSGHRAFPSSQFAT